MEIKRVYLTMEVGGELFAVAVDRTREILDSITSTRLPNMPEYMAGVINVRGSAIPVVDLRLKLELPVHGESGTIPVIVLEIPGKEDVMLVGVMVDEVREVVEVSSENMEDTPSMGKGLMADFLGGMYQHGERLVMVLDTEKLFTEDEQDLFSGVGEPVSESDGVGSEAGKKTVEKMKEPEPALAEAEDARFPEPDQLEQAPGAMVEESEPVMEGAPEPAPQEKRKRKPFRRKKKVQVEVEMKLTQQMVKAGMTIAELAEKIDMDRRTLKRLVTKGNPNTTIATLKRIAEGIGCSWKELVD